MAIPKPQTQPFREEWAVPGEHTLWHRAWATFLVWKCGVIFHHTLRGKKMNKFYYQPDLFRSLMNHFWIRRPVWDDSEYPEYISVELLETGKIFPFKPPVVTVTWIIDWYTLLQLSVVSPFHTTACWAPRVHCPAYSGSSWSEGMALSLSSVPVTPPLGPTLSY